MEISLQEFTFLENVSTTALDKRRKERKNSLCALSQ